MWKNNNKKCPLNGQWPTKKAFIEGEKTLVAARVSLTLPLTALGSIANYSLESYCYCNLEVPKLLFLFYYFFVIHAILNILNSQEGLKKVQRCPYQLFLWVVERF